MRISTSGSMAVKRMYSTGVPWKSLAISTARSCVRLVTKTWEQPERRRWRAASSLLFPAPTIITAAFEFLVGDGEALGPLQPFVQRIAVETLEGHETDAGVS